ncbi:MAG: hypothetical protein IPK74_09205 [Deltaproteobacteria bacterium]|nr:hypothetical protein [Deltaproteobacteria bacterium]
MSLHDHPLGLLGEDLDASLGAWSGDAMPPGFADVVARAMRQGAVLDEDALERARVLDQLDDDELAHAAKVGDVDDFIADARDFVAAQGVDEAPPMLPPRRARRRPWVIGVSLAAAAAMVLLVGGVVQQLRTHAVEASATDGSEFSHAPDHASAQETEGVVQPRAASPRVQPRPTPEPQHEAEAEPESMVEPEPAAATPSPPRASFDAAGLDAQARAAWRDGDLGLAQRRLEQLVRRGGRSTLVDLAYGDLFALARQRDQPSKLRSYWRAYVERFPKGRFIDDARAGLCRSLGGDAQVRCWASYLRDRPDGTYRAHAESIVRAGKLPGQ